jgi:AraC-like DNA-binding protein
MNRDLLRENRIHGDAIFPLHVYVENPLCIDQVLECHWHEELEFLVVTEGKAVFQIETSYYEVQEGQAIFINSGEIHAGHLLDGSKCSFTAVVFNRNLLYSNVFDTVQSKYIEPFLKKQYSFSPHIKENDGWQKEVLTNMTNLINDCKDKPFAYELSVNSKLYNILSLIISHSSIDTSLQKSSGITYKTQRLKVVLNYIQSNFNRKITIKELAELINMSEGHFCRFFKLMIQKTPVDYINYYRITKACSFLEDKTKKIIEVALETGFDNFSYFIETFKHYMNCTPSEYRNRLS